ncbi:hypothetical protein EYF80_042792 [Liparis tanakae]|uniref:Uncharacterized protein n=1 Tax=Liparis tanakae TaxID=230148 RepID=A0A4Z2G172_9TELE|nr:hypothetical protein EYF80_042792 [Liparis tanakae]
MNPKTLGKRHQQAKCGLWLFDSESASPRQRRIGETRGGELQIDACLRFGRGGINRWSLEVDIRCSHIAFRWELSIHVHAWDIYSTIHFWQRGINIRSGLYPHVPGGAPVLFPPRLHQLFHFMTLTEGETTTPTRQLTSHFRNPKLLPDGYWLLIGWRLG